MAQQDLGGGGGYQKELELVLPISLGPGPYNRELQNLTRLLRVVSQGREAEAIHASIP